MTLRRVLAVSALLCAVLSPIVTIGIPLLVVAVILLAVLWLV